jgi:hypothetical protein
LTQSFTDIDNDALDALIERVTEAKDHELALSPDNCQLLLNALMTLASLQENIASKDVTVHKLKNSPVSFNRQKNWWHSLVSKALPHKVKKPNINGRFNLEVHNIYAASAGMCIAII